MPANELFGFAAAGQEDTALWGHKLFLPAYICPNRDRTRSHPLKNCQRNPFIL